jgi:hypothetical protein
MLATRPPVLLAITTAAVLLVPHLGRRPANRELTADDIVQASLTAQGGCARLEGVRELTFTGRVVDHETGQTAHLSVWNQAPRNMRMVVTWPGNLDYQLEVMDGVVTVDQGVIDGARDRRLVTGAEREQLLSDSGFPCDASAEDPFERSRLVGMTDFEGTRAYQIEWATQSAVTRTSYIAVDTLLPIGMERITSTERASWEPAGPPHVALVRFSSSDYRRVGGVLMPFQWRQSTIAGDRYLHTSTVYLDKVTAKRSWTDGVITYR